MGIRWKSLNWDDWDGWKEIGHGGAIVGFFFVFPGIPVLYERRELN